MLSAVNRYLRLLGDRFMTNATPLSSEAIIAVIGAGAMGEGSAQVAAMAGHRVMLHDARALVATHAIAGIETALRKLAERGKLAASEVPVIAARLSSTESLADCKPAALVIEAIVEDLLIKRELFAKLEDVVGDDAILATNTSSISVTSIGAALRRPQRLLGMHFFNSAPLMQLVEVVSGVATEPEVANAVFATASAWGKVPVHAKSTPGFIVNRVARSYYAEGHCIGLPAVCRVLDNIQKTYGEDRYRTSAWLRRKAVGSGLAPN